MAVQPTAAPAGSRDPDDQRVAGAQFICGTGSLVAVLAALGPTLDAVLYLFPSLIDQDPQNRGSGT
jgi:hypothetical protein